MTLKQDYSKYTKEDQEIWNILYSRQFSNIADVATQAFGQGLKDIHFKETHIPHFGETNELLDQITGWEVVAAKGIVDDDLFFELLSNKKFPATTWLRTKEQLDYLEEPDMFHDVFGHIPLLTNQPYVDFLQGLSKIGLEYLDNEWAIHLLSRIYWFTIEFGLIREEDKLKIYGAGIISSPGETKFSLSDEPEHLPYDVAKILDTTYRKDTFQTMYYIIDSYEQLYNSLPQIEEELKKRVAEKTVEGC